MEKKPSERINELFREEEKRLSSVANFANAIMNYLDEEWEKKQEEARREKRFQELSDGHKYMNQYDGVSKEVASDLTFKVPEGDNVKKSITCDVQVKE